MTTLFNHPINHSFNEDYHYRVRVYYEDTDAAGVVYHTNYLKWMERARTEWLHTQELSSTQLLRDGCTLAVYHIDITYHQPARLEEVVSVGCKLLEVGFSRFRIHQRIERYNRLLAEATITLACIDPISFKATRLPKKVKQQFERYLPPQNSVSKD